MLYTALISLPLLSFAYLIMCLQVRSGFPPIYRRVMNEHALVLLLPFAVALMVSLGAGALWGILKLPFVEIAWLGFGLVSIAFALKVRTLVKRETVGPMLWLLTPLTGDVFAKWPMLVFDVWTLGITLAFAFLISM